MTDSDKQQTPKTDGTPGRTGDSDRNSVDEVTPANDPATPAPVEKYTLKKVTNEEEVIPGLVELEVVADGTFESNLGEVLRTGDRKLVSNTDAKTLLDVKVNGKSAFKAV